MNKRGKLITVFIQIFLIISISFSLSLLLSNNIVKSQDPPNFVDNAKLRLDLDFGGGTPPSPSTVGTGTSSAGDVYKKLGGDEAIDKTGGKPAGGITDFITDIYGGRGFGFEQGSPGGSLVSGAAWALTVYFAVKFIGSFAGLDEGLTNALASSLGAGVFVGRTAFLLAEKSGELFGLTAGQGAFLLGAGVAIVVFIALYKKESVKAVQFQCLPYEPPLGGNSCEVCNEDPFRPCSEYRCKSLGQACELVNPGTEEEKCVWVNPGDVNSPTITPWDEALTPNHRYTSHETRPSNLGTKIVYENSADGCLAAFTPLTFGFTTNEQAQCKISNVHTDTYEDMTFYVGETNYFLQEHTQTMRLPGPDSLNSEAIAEGAPEFQNDGIYDFYVRCIDANGNENVDEFVFSFCVDPSPDTTPPIIEDTSITSGSPVAFESNEVPVEFYTNEPAVCKWSIDDKEYDLMENTMSCATSVTEINSRLLYTCATTLTGIKDREENNYFVRCKDQPTKPENERNVNVQSYPFTLRGTQPLNIISVAPNDTITDSRDIVQVSLELETSNGAEEGKASCFFSNSGDEGTYIAMFETNNFAHRQTLSLAPGDYNYYFRCVDAGGNSDETTTSFTVFSDNDAPQITRAYKDLDALKVVTNEPAECVYSLNSCNYIFDEGINMIHSNPTLRMTSYAEWNPNQVYYIKCRDDFGNEPDPNTCSLVASATNII